MNWKQLARGTLAAALALTLCACGGSPAPASGTDSGAAQDTENNAVQETENSAVQETDGTVELIVFAAASLQETLDEIRQSYMADHPGVTVTCSYESSGTLKTQIQEGAPCDIFISAGQKQMNQLDIAETAESNPERLDFVLDGTRRNLLENKVSLSVPEGNPAGITSFEDLRVRLEAGTVLLAMGNGDVPAGQYAQRILAYYGLSEADLAAAGCVTYGSNVKEVTAQVSEAAVDCGIIYQTDAFSAGLTVVDTATEEMCGQVIYPAAVLNVTEHPVEAGAFLDYLSTPEAGAVFASVGFTPIT